MADQKEKAAADFQATTLINMKARLGSKEEELQRAKEILDQAREDKRLRSLPPVITLTEEEDTVPKEGPNAPPFKPRERKRPHQNRRATQTTSNKGQVKEISTLSTQTLEPDRPRPVRIRVPRPRPRASLGLPLMTNSKSEQQVRAQPSGSRTKISANNSSKWPSKDSMLSNNSKKEKMPSKDSSNKNSKNLPDNSKNCCYLLG